MKRNLENKFNERYDLVASHGENQAMLNGTGSNKGSHTEGEQTGGY
jgi:hypothetical protein